MDIHHAMMVRSRPARVYEALTRQSDLEIWMDAPTIAGSEVGSNVQFQYDAGARSLKFEIIALEENLYVKWKVIESVWASYTSQNIQWRLSAYDGSTLVDFRMDGLEQDDDIYASVSYKWAMFMVRLKIHLGDTREIVSLLPIEKRSFG